MYRLHCFCLLNPCFVLATLATTLVLIFYDNPRPKAGWQTDRVIEIEGWIYRPPQMMDDSIYLEISPLQLRQSEPLDSPGRLALYIASSGTDPRTFFEPPLRYGEILAITSFLQDPLYYSVPGVVDLRQSFWNQGISHLIRLKSPLQVERKGHHPIGSLFGPLFRYRFEDFCWNRLKDSNLKLVLSVWLGERKILDENDINLLKKLGIFHIFVVSGLHVSMVVFLLHRLLRRWSPGRIVTLAGLWTYILLIGFSLPTLRAGIMATLFYLFLTCGLSRQFLNILGISGLLLLVCWPASVLAPGFQFSYLSLTAIGLFALPLDGPLRNLFLGLREPFSDSVLISREPDARLRRRARFLIEEKMQFWPKTWLTPVLELLSYVLLFLIRLVLSGAFIQLLTLPLNLLHSNRWIWTQWLANLILLPLFSLFIPLCLSLFLTFWLPTGPLLAKLVSGCADGLWFFMSGLQKLNWVSYLRQPEPLETVIYLVLFATGCRIPAGKLRLTAFLSPLLLWLGLHSPARHSPGQLSITMLDVGQGESLHIRYPDGRDALVDTGGLLSKTRSASHFVGERLVSRYLWHQRTRRLDYVLLTHPHADHIQGYDFIRQAFPVDRLLFHQLDRVAARPQAVQLKTGDEFTLAQVKHRILHPPRGGAWDSNNSSLVFEMQYGRFKMLFTGDIEREAEHRLVPHLQKVTVLKASHHGSHTSNTRELLKATEPQLAIISAGRRNRFGHPAASTLKRFQEARVPVLSTPQWGSIRIETDGISWRVLHYSMKKQSFQEVPHHGFGNHRLHGLTNTD